MPTQVLESSSKCYPCKFAAYSLSKEFIKAINSSPTQNWKLASNVDMNPTILSKLMAGRLRAKGNDILKLLEIAKAINFKGEIVVSHKE